MLITESERKVLTALQYNHYEDGIWSWAVNHSEKPSGIEGHQLAGVVGSLVKKGLVISEEYEPNESVIYVTDAGKALGFDSSRL